MVTGFRLEVVRIFVLQEIKTALSKAALTKVCWTGWRVSLGLERTAVHRSPQELMSSEQQNESQKKCK